MIEEKKRKGNEKREIRRRTDSICRRYQDRRKWWEKTRIL